uniref:Uncharacterized protein n=1 Tax=Magallana gigas TaxID=29159 RepID=A0A8W8MPK0_MAGGI
MASLLCFVINFRNPSVMFIIDIQKRAGKLRTGCTCSNIVGTLFFGFVSLEELKSKKSETTQSFPRLQKKWVHCLPYLPLLKALSSLHEKKYNKPMLIPLVEDVKKLNIYLDTEAKRVCLEVKDNPHLYAELAQICLAQVILFNRRRSGEAERMTLSAFSEAIKIGSGKPDNVVLSTLNAFEKTLCHSHIRVEIKDTVDEGGLEEDHPPQHYPIQHLGPQKTILNQEDLTGERTVPFTGNCRPLG